MQPYDYDPFYLDWAALLDRPVYSSDKKKVGFLRKVLPEYLVVKQGFVNLSSYVIPKCLVHSIDKKGIMLGITASQVHSRYSYVKMKYLVPGNLPKSAGNLAVRDRVVTFRRATSRNRLAAAMAFLSGILFIISGYKADIEIYDLVREQIAIHTVRDFWIYAVIPVGLLAMLSQLGGITVLMGGGLFAANRVNVGKFLVGVGTGQGLFTILLRILQELWSGRLMLDNNYIIWLTSTAAGLGILFAVTSQSVSKGKGSNLTFGVVKFALKLVAAKRRRTRKTTPAEKGRKTTKNVGGGGSKQ